jgi:hypothetical protein
VRIEDAARKIAAYVREEKEGWLRGLNQPGKRTDIPMLVTGYRVDDPVVTIRPSEIDRDIALYAARIAAIGFGCDLLALSTESWHPVEEHRLKNPYTGKPWGETARSMQQAANEHDALAKGVLVESLFTTVVNRAGDVVSVMQDYRIDVKINALGIARYGIEWLEAEPLVMDSRDENSQVSGIIPESMIEYMNSPTIQHLLAKFGLSGADFDLNPVQTQAHIDCATVKQLIREHAIEAAIILMSDDPQRTEVIDRSLHGYIEFGRGR